MTWFYLQQSGAIRQLIGVWTLGRPLREMTRQQVADGIDACDRADLKPSRAKMLLHQAAYRLPLGGADLSLEAAVRDYFDIAIRQLHIDQHAVVRFGIPHAQV